MDQQDRVLFRLLKQKVAAVFLVNHQTSHPEMKHWKGQEITDFQEDLLAKVQGRISEKWFYTHIKAEQNKLPRVDLLNLLSAYAGYQNWADFQAQHPSEENQGKDPFDKRKRAALIAVGLLVPWLLMIVFTRDTVHTFCFSDADQNRAIVDGSLEVLVLSETESPIVLKVDSSGCIDLPSKDDRLQIVVRGPYYKADTITRIASNGGQEQVRLRTNDYALMIHLFSHSKLRDWHVRREQLQRMIAEEAEIYQINQARNKGIRLYNKAEFIDKLTMPVNSLKNIEVLETVYRGDQIVHMRFWQKSAE